MRLIAELSMPSNNSWNGRWSGQENKYTVAINATEKRAKELLGSYRYSFGDGWVACVTIRKPEYREKATNKFCGYNWMIDSIRQHGEIK